MEVHGGYPQGTTSSGVQQLLTQSFLRLEVGNGRNKAHALYHPGPRLACGLHTHVLDDTFIGSSAHDKEEGDLSKGGEELLEFEALESLA